MTATLPPGDTLPSGYTFTRPRVDDVPELLALVHASDTEAIGAPDCSAEDLHEVFDGPHHDPEHDSWVVIDPAGGFAAWAYVENLYGYPEGVVPRERIEVTVRPGAPALHGLLMTTAVDRAVQRVRAAGRDEVRLATNHVLGQEDLRAAIVGAGFTFERRYARMHRDFTGDEQAPSPPAGVRLRQVDPDRDARTLYRIVDTAFRDLSDYTSTGFEAWWPSVDVAATPWDECLFAEVGGEPVAALQSAGQAITDGGGWIRNLAVLPTHRGRGLARLLLTTAFATYAAKGRTWAGLGADTDNATGAFHLYESVGMHAAYKSDIYTQTLHL